MYMKSFSELEVDCIIRPMHISAFKYMYHSISWDNDEQSIKFPWPSFSLEAYLLIQ